MMDSSFLFVWRRKRKYTFFRDRTLLKYFGKYNTLEYRRKKIAREHNRYKISLLHTWERHKKWWFTVSSSIFHTRRYTYIVRDIKCNSTIRSSVNNLTSARTNLSPTPSQPSILFAASSYVLLDPSNADIRMCNIVSIYYFIDRVFIDRTRMNEKWNEPKPKSDSLATNNPHDNPPSRVYTHVYTYVLSLNL